MVELEKTYLARYLPTDLTTLEHQELLDIYLPAEDIHPKLRLRQKSDLFEITKKTQLTKNDASTQLEETIPLTKAEFASLAVANGKKIHKIRYLYPYQGRTAEIDVFMDDLSGLVLVDFEFTSAKEKDDFPLPDFCLVDVTQEEFIAGGMLCGKSYADIQGKLDEFHYQPISLP